MTDAERLQLNLSLSLSLSLTQTLTLTPNLNPNPSHRLRISDLYTALESQTSTGFLDTYNISRHARDPRAFFGLDAGQDGHVSHEDLAYFLFRKKKKYGAAILTELLLELEAGMKPVEGEGKQRVVCEEENYGASKGKGVIDGGDRLNLEAISGIEGMEGIGDLGGISGMKGLDERPLRDRSMTTESERFYFQHAL